MYKPIPPRAKLLSKKVEAIHEQKSSRRLLKQKGPIELAEGKREASISRKMEEKYIYNVKRTSVERSSSIGINRKGKTDKMIDEEYRINRVKQIQKEEEREVNCMELGCNSRESYKGLQIQPPVPRLRLLRARSNDSFSKMMAGKTKETEDEIKLKSLKDQNAYLKQLHTQSLNKIQQLQKLQIQEKNSFVGQTKVYERQIQLLRGKVDKNKVDIGHLFSYESFDPATLLVKPIIQVQENSSILRSLYNTSKNSGIRGPQIQCEYGLYDKPIKKIATQTTALSSQNYRQTADLF